MTSPTVAWTSLTVAMTRASWTFPLLVEPLLTWPVSLLDSLAFSSIDAEDGLGLAFAALVGWVGLAVWRACVSDGRGLGNGDANRADAAHRTAMTAIRALRRPIGFTQS